jgi:hypothetical protein
MHSQQQQTAALSSIKWHPMLMQTLLTASDLQLHTSDTMLSCHVPPCTAFGCHVLLLVYCTGPEDLWAADQA